LGSTYLPLNFSIFTYEYVWAPGGSGPGSSSGYYVGILQYNDTLGLGYFLTTQYTNNPKPSLSVYYYYLSELVEYYEYYDYYSGSGWSGSNLNYYFLEDNTGEKIGYHGSNYFVFMLPDQQKNKKDYYQYGVFWLYNWFQAGNNNNMNIYFLMNGNIFNYSLASEPYMLGENCWWFGWDCSPYYAYAIPPNPPASTNTITGEPIFVQSYINAYNTAFNQPTNHQVALYAYAEFYSNNVNNDFISGTFGYDEKYSNSNGKLFKVNRLVDSISNYIWIPYLFISTGSGGGSGFMYLDWIIVTYGVPYIISVS